jgi:hypothetical protein
MYDLLIDFCWGGSGNETRAIHVTKLTSIEVQSEFGCIAFSKKEYGKVFSAVQAYDLYLLWLVIWTSN